MYENLNLRAWPFQTVPDEDFAHIWAGRLKTKSQIDRLIWKMQMSPKSGLRLLWANFGMGKTHTLLHMRWLCEQSKGHLIPIYAVFPNHPTSFLDVYRAIATAMPFEQLGEQLVRVGNSSAGSVAQHPLFVRAPGVVCALLAMRTGDFEKVNAARQWLAAQPGLTLREMRTIGVTYRMRTAEDAVNGLTALVRLATFGNPGGKVVVMIDEYQRIGELRTSVRTEMNAGLHAFYNANPSGLETMLSFSFGRRENVAYLLSDELKSRAEPESVSLDVLTSEEAVEFAKDLLGQFRLRDDGRWAFPFTPEALHEIVHQAGDGKPLTPRRLMLVANDVLLEALAERSAAEEAAAIERADVRRILARLSESGLGGENQDAG